MKSLHILPAAAAALSLVAAVAMAQSEPAKKADGILVDQAGRTLYVFDKDAADSGKSACAGQCAAMWPPVVASGDLKSPFSAITREDGSKQLAYKGKPLYLYAQDKSPGDRSGDNFRDVWHVVKD